MNMTLAQKLNRYAKIKRAANKIDKERTNRRTELRRKWESIHEQRGLNQ